MCDLSRAMRASSIATRRCCSTKFPAAYKDIDHVMEHAKDLVEIKYVLKQFVNVKGD